MSNTEKKPYCVESDRRMILYEKHRAPFDRFIHGMETPSDGDDDDGEAQFVTAFGIFLQCEVFLTGTRLTSFQASFKKWNSMSAKDKAPFVTLSADRMKIHELMSIEFFASLLDKYREVTDGGSSSGDSEGTGWLHAKNGLLVFLEQFIAECDDNAKVLDPKKSGYILVEEQIQKWYMMSEEEQGPYHAEATRLMNIYEHNVFEACARMARMARDRSR